MEPRFQFIEDFIKHTSPLGTTMDPPFDVPCSYLHWLGRMSAEDMWDCWGPERVWTQMSETDRDLSAFRFSGESLSNLKFRVSINPSPNLDSIQDLYTYSESGLFIASDFRNFLRGGRRLIMQDFLSNGIKRVCHLNWSRTRVFIELSHCREGLVFQEGKIFWGKEEDEGFDIENSSFLLSSDLFSFTDQQKRLLLRYA